MRQCWPEIEKNPAGFLLRPSSDGITAAPQQYHHISSLSSYINPCIAIIYLPCLLTWSRNKRWLAKIFEQWEHWKFWSVKGIENILSQQNSTGIIQNYSQICWHISNSKTDRNTTLFCSSLLITASFCFHSREFKGRKKNDKSPVALMLFEGTIYVLSKCNDMGTVNDGLMANYMTDNQWLNSI